MLKELKTIGPRVGSTPGLNETEEEGGLMGRGPGPLSKEQCFPQGGETIRFNALQRSSWLQCVYILHRLKSATVRLHHCEFQDLTISKRINLATSASFTLKRRFS